MKFGGGWSADDTPKEEEGEHLDDLNVVVCQDDEAEDSQDILSVGDRLYCKVFKLQPEFADRITGMLLECDDEKIDSMLNDDAYLEEMVHRTVEVLADEDSSENDTDDSFSDSDSDDDESREELGEAIYERVEELEPELCGQITGMLLELDETVVHELLQSRDALEKAVAKARDEYLQHVTASPAGSSSTDDDDELSCELFNLVLEKCPENADRITGMLLELDQKVVEKLLENPTALDASIEKAKVAIYEEGMV